MKRADIKIEIGCYDELESDVKYFDERVSDDDIKSIVYERAIEKAKVDVKNDDDLTFLAAYVPKYDEENRLWIHYLIDETIDFFVRYTVNIVNERDE